MGGWGFPPKFCQRPPKICQMFTSQPKKYILNYNILNIYFYLSCANNSKVNINCKNVLYFYFKDLSTLCYIKKCIKIIHYAGT